MQITFGHRFCDVFIYKPLTTSHELLVGGAATQISSLPPKDFNVYEHVGYCSNTGIRVNLWAPYGTGNKTADDCWTECAKAHPASGVPSHEFWNDGDSNLT